MSDSVFVLLHLLLRPWRALARSVFHPFQRQGYGHVKIRRIGRYVWQISDFRFDNKGISSGIEHDLPGSRGTADARNGFICSVCSHLGSTPRHFQSAHPQLKRHRRRADLTGGIVPDASEECVRVIDGELI
jgi:hypothetical protein